VRSEPRGRERRAQTGGADVTAEPTAAGHPTGRSRSQHQRRKRILQAAAALASRGGVEAMQMRTVAGEYSRLGFRNRPSRGSDQHLARPPLL